MWVPSSSQPQTLFLSRASPSTSWRQTRTAATTPPSSSPPRSMRAMRRSRIKLLNFLQYFYLSSSLCSSRFWWSYLESWVSVETSSVLLFSQGDLTFSKSSSECLWQERNEKQFQSHSDRYQHMWQVVPDMRIGWGSNCFSFHLIFASMDAVRNSFGEFYPVHLLHIFPYVHYPFYRWGV